MTPPPVTTESTSATAAHAIAGRMAKRHGLLLAQRIARPDRARHRAPAAATTKKATAPMARDSPDRLQAKREPPDDVQAEVTGRDHPAGHRRGPPRRAGHGRPRDRHLL